MARTLDDQRYKQIISRLRARRTDTGLTQEDVAIVVGKPQSFVAKIEGLERRLDVLEFVDLCEAIGIEPGDVLQKKKNPVEDQNSN